MPPFLSVRERLSTWASDDGNRDTGAGVVVAPATHFSQGPRVYPTRFGAAFLGVALLTLLGCVNYQLSLGYLVTFVMAGLWVGGAVSASRSLSGLSLSAAPPPEAWATQGAAFQVKLSNPSAPPRERLRLRLHQPRRAALSVIDVPAGAQVVVPIVLTPARRGPLSLPRLRLEGRDLLGLWRGVTYPLLRAEVLAYPAPEVGAPALPRPYAAEGEGLQRRSAQEDFAGVRPYVAGDAPRQVAWRHSARTGELHSKVFDAPASASLLLSYRELGNLGSEEKLSRLTAWVVRAQQQGARYRLELPHEAGEEGSGPEHAQRSLRRLALFEAAL